MIAGTYKGDKPINISGFDKSYLKCDCIIASVVNSIREPIFCSFALNKLPEKETYKKPRIRLFEKIKKAVLFHITFYLEDDDHKLVDFIGEKVSFTSQLVKIKFYIIR